MTPGARIAATIEILDAILEGTPAERCLTNWARKNRFAGSKDRAAIRDHVFSCLRNLRSFARLGGWSGQWPPSGRSVAIGLVKNSGTELATIFSGEGYAPAQLTGSEAAEYPASEADSWNLPDWLIAAFKTSLGDDAHAQAQALGQRAPITIRANALKTTRADVQRALSDSGIETAENPLSPHSLTAQPGERRLAQTDLFREGMFELQDAASQAIVDQLDIKAGMRCLDFCAGGGGKTLAMAAYSGASVTAHDANPDRMAGLKDRAYRASASVRIESDLSRLAQHSFDLVLVDAPCSGSGSWRRAPDAKWRLTPERLAELVAIQKDILSSAARFVAQGGSLAYATCSVLTEENETQIQTFLKDAPGWTPVGAHRWPIDENGDGFFLTKLLEPSPI